MNKKSILFAFLALLPLLIAGCNSRATGNAVVDSGGYVKIPLSEVNSQVKFYTFNDKGIDINYFVVKGSDGGIRVAFDACDVCGGYKGYRQKGNDVICNNCGRFFSIQDIGTKNRGGGCWPSYLTNKIEGDNILIKKSELAKGAFRFK